jgi:cytidylate kinase
MDKNILVSGWPGGGSTALTFSLTKIFGFKLLRGSETFRYLWKKLSYSTTGEENLEAERLIQPFFGKVYDQYIDYKIMNSSRFVIDSDIGGFRLGKRSEYYSIFLAAKKEERYRRLSSDNREKEIEFLEERENELRERYKELHNIDWFDPAEIQQKHNIVIDNSEITIEEEIARILGDMLELEILEKEEYEMYSEKIDEVVSDYWEIGKDSFLQQLLASNQVADAPEVLKEIAEQFKKEIEEFPEKLKNVINFIS